MKKLDKKFIYGAIAASFILLLVVLSILGYMENEKYPEGSVLIKTSMGNIVVYLDLDNAPITVNNFLYYVDSGFYSDLVFHRVIPGFMIQGGGFKSSGQQKNTLSPINLESNNGLKNVEYSIAMARTNYPNSPTSQFFINTQDNSFLDYTSSNPGYAVFGKVIDGKDVVDLIEKVKTETKFDRMENWPIENVVIYSIERV